MKYAGIIFDFNGVLVWDSALHEKAWNEFSLKYRGKPLNDDEITQRVHGRTNTSILRYLVGEQLSDLDIHHLAIEKEVCYQSLCLDLEERFILSPGAIELLDLLAARHIPRTIATASCRVNLDFYIQKFQLGRWFDIHNIVFDDGSFPGKPEPHIYRKAAANIGVAPEKCIVVEDAISGIQAAQRAGIGKIYAIGPQEQHVRLNKIAGVNEVINNVGELPINVFFSNN